MRYLLLILLLLVSTSAEARHHYHHRHHRHHTTERVVVPTPRPRPVVSTVFDTGYYSFRNFTDWECLLPSQFRMWDNPIPVPTMVAVVKPVRAQSLTYNGMSVKGSYILLAGAVMLLLGAIYPTDWWPFSRQLRCRNGSLEPSANLAVIGRTHIHKRAGWKKFFGSVSSLMTVRVMKAILGRFLRRLVSLRSWPPLRRCTHTVVSGLSSCIWILRRRMIHPPNGG